MGVAKGNYRQMCMALGHECGNHRGKINLLFSPKFHRSQFASIRRDKVRAVPAVSIIKRTAIFCIPWVSFVPQENIRDITLSCVRSFGTYVPSVPHSLLHFISPLLFFFSLYPPPTPFFLRDVMHGVQ
jgi:hypothetical protein